MSSEGLMEEPPEAPWAGETPHAEPAETRNWKLFAVKVVLVIVAAIVLYQLPLYYQEFRVRQFNEVIFLSVAVGLLIGFVWEWLREGPLRAQAQGHARRADALAREVGRMRAEKADRGEDILALLDAPKRR